MLAGYRVYLGLESGRLGALHDRLCAMLCQSWKIAEAEIKCFSLHPSVSSSPLCFKSPISVTREIHGWFTKEIGLKVRQGCHSGVVIVPVQCCSS